MLNPIVRLTAGQMRLRLFLRALTMSLLNAGGIYLIAHGSWFCGATGFLISWNWISAARDGVDHRVRYSRLAYAIGGLLGAWLGMSLSKGLYRMHLL